MLYFSHIPKISVLQNLLSSFSEPFAFFIDFNNNVVSLYDEKRLLNLIGSFDSEGLRNLLTPLIEQTLLLLKGFPQSKVILHLESGRSLYHQRIRASYKLDRQYTWTMLTPKQVETFREMLKLLKEIVTELFHLFPRTHVVHLQFLEADFIPYYVTSRQLLPNHLSISFSSDKDLFQQLSLDNFLIQIRQLPSIKDQRKSYITKKTAVYAFTNKEDFLHLEFVPEESRMFVRKILVSWLPAVLAIAGDSDEFKGVPRLGYTSIYTALIKYLHKLSDGFKNLELIAKFDLTKTTCENRIETFHKLLEELVEANKRYKVWQQVPELYELVLQNFKLADFECLSCYVDKIPETKQYIEKRVSDESTIDTTIFKQALKELLNIKDTSTLDHILSLYDQVAGSDFSDNDLF